MLKIQKTQIVLIVLAVAALSSLTVAAQVNPKFVFHHEDINGYITGLSFSHDNTKLLTAGGFYAMMWDLKTGEKIMTFPKHSGLGPIDFSIDDKRIVTAHIEHEKVSIWDAQSGKEIKTFQGEIDLPGPVSYTGISLTLDGSKILAGDGDGGLYVIDIEQEKVVQKFKGLGGYVNNIQCYPDGDRIAVSHCVISLDSGEIIEKFDSRIFLSYDEKEIFSFNVLYNPFRSYSTIVWDSETLEKKNEHPYFVVDSEISVSPNGNMIAFAGEKEKSPRVMDIQSNKEMRKFGLQGKENVIFDKAEFSRDGKMVVFIKDDIAYVYDISDLTASAQSGEALKN
jgi:WD40 repeat protein